MHDSEKVFRPNVDGESAANRRPRVGLALGAGAARGWAHIGVIEKLQEAGIKPDIIAGTSIGAVVGGALATGKLPELVEWARSLKEMNFWRWLDLRFGGGMFGGDRLSALMRDTFCDLDFEDLTCPLTAVSCDLKTGHEVWLNSGNLADGIRASFALPGVFEPKQIDNRWLVDGALVNPVPVSVCRAAGCEIVLAVNLAEDLYGRARALQDEQVAEYGVFRELSKAPSAVGRRVSKSLFSAMLKRKDQGPSLLANMVASLNIMQNRLSRSRLAGDPPDITIVPRVGHIGLMEFYRADELIEEGRRAYDEIAPHLDDALTIIMQRLVY